MLISNTGFDAQSVKRMHKEDDAEELQFVAENTRARAKQQREEMNVINNSNFLKQQDEPPVTPGAHSGENVDEMQTDESAAAVPSKTPVFTSGAHVPIDYPLQYLMDIAFLRAIV